MKENWVYRRGDIYLANLGVPIGSKQGGVRPDSGSSERCRQLLFADDYGCSSDNEDSKEKKPANTLFPSEGKRAGKIFDGIGGSSLIHVIRPV